MLGTWLCLELAGARKIVPLIIAAGHETKSASYGNGDGSVVLSAGQASMHEHHRSEVP